MPNDANKMIIYDLEIQKLVPPRDGKILPDFNYCAGWTDYVGMGLACLALYDCVRQEYHVFDEFNLDQIQKRFDKTDLINACLDDENLVGWREYFDQIKILWL